MKQFFILNKTDYYTPKDPKWRSLGFYKYTYIRPVCMYLHAHYELVDDPQIRIPLLRKLEL